jgi:hypothetical protein
MRVASGAVTVGVFADGTAVGELIRSRIRAVIYHHR